MEVKYKIDFDFCIKHLDFSVMNLRHVDQNDLAKKAAKIIEKITEKHWEQQIIYNSICNKLSDTIEYNITTGLIIKEQK